MDSTTEYDHLDELIKIALDELIEIASKFAESIQQVQDASQKWREMYESENRANN